MNLGGNVKYIDSLTDMTRSLSDASTIYPVDQFGGDELSVETYIVGLYNVMFDLRHLLWLFSRNF
jgi:hypothetical protein